MQTRVVDDSSGERPASLDDAADGILHRPPANEETARLLKRLGYPEIAEATRPSTLLTKARDACQKRLKRLEDLMPQNTNIADFEAEPDPAASQTLYDRRLDRTICAHAQD